MGAEPGQKLRPAPGQIERSSIDFVISMNFDRDQGYPAQPERRQLLRAAATLGALPLAGGLGNAQAATLAFAPAAFEVHDDRAVFFVPRLTGTQVFRHRVRAVHVGAYTALPAAAKAVLSRRFPTIRISFLPAATAAC